MPLIDLHFHVYDHDAKHGAERVLQHLWERIKDMPTKEEVKAAVAAAASAEAEQVATKIKELEDRLANGSLTDADRDELVSMVQNIFTPAPQPAPGA